MRRYVPSVLYILLLALGALAFFSIAGVRIGVIAPINAFALLKISVFASLTLSIFALLSVFGCRCQKGSGQKRFFCFVSGISFLYSAFWVAFYWQRSELPEINDITTDFANPPAYIDVPMVRLSKENKTLYPKDFYPLQEKYYPDIQALLLKNDIASVFDSALYVAQGMGWELVSSYPQSGVFEATARTPVFGFRDDVVVRISKVDETTRVDVRSSSRIGKGDLGVNADRIETFMQNLNDHLQR